MLRLSRSFRASEYKRSMLCRGYVLQGTRCVEKLSALNDRLHDEHAYYPGLVRKRRFDHHTCVDPGWFCQGRRCRSNTVMSVACTASYCLATAAPLFAFSHCRSQSPLPVRCRYRRAAPLSPPLSPVSESAFHEYTARSMPALRWCVFHAQRLAPARPLTL